MKYRKYEVNLYVSDPETERKHREYFIYVAKSYKSRARILKDLKKSIHNMMNNDEDLKKLHWSVELGKCKGHCEL